MPAERRDDDAPSLTPALRDGQRATTYVLLGILLTSLPHPWSLSGLVAALAALLLASRATVRQVRAQRWGWAAWHLVAVAFAGYLLWMGGIGAAYPDQLQSWSECSKAANTHQAQAGCDAELMRSTPAWLSRVLGLG